LAHNALRALKAHAKTKDQRPKTKDRMIQLTTNPSMTINNV